MSLETSSSDLRSRVEDLWNVDHSDLFSVTLVSYLTSGTLPFLDPRKNRVFVSVRVWASISF